jgi:hypothetical protein
MNFRSVTEHVREAAFDLREHVPQRVPTSACVRKTEPKMVKPVLNLADYVSAEADPPAAVHRSNLANSALADILGNGDWGDCGDAMSIHGIEAMHLDAGTPVPPFHTADALWLYGKVSGFNINAGPPGANPTDTGTDNQQLVDFWRDHGIICSADGSVHKIAGSLFIDPKDTRLSRIAIWEFVVLFSAAGLPNTAQGQSYWKVTDPSLQGDAAVGSWGYHDFIYLSYDDKRLRNDTWGEELLVDWDWKTDYGVQDFVVVTEEMLNLRGTSPAGVDWTRLNADLAKFPPAPPQS